MIKSTMRFEQHTYLSMHMQICLRTTSPTLNQPKPHEPERDFPGLLVGTGSNIDIVFKWCNRGSAAFGRVPLRILSISWKPDRIFSRTRQCYWSFAFTRALYHQSRYLRKRDVHIPYDVYSFSSHIVFLSHSFTDLTLTFSASFLSDIQCLTFSYLILWLWVVYPALFFSQDADGR